MAGDLEARLERLEAEVRELRDREAIRELRMSYHECVNQGRWSEIAALLPFVKQFIHNHAIVLHGDRATGTSYLEAKSVSDGRAYVVAGRYEDSYERREGEWRFARMDFIPYFTVPFDEGWAQEDLLKMGRR